MKIKPNSAYFKQTVMKTYLLRTTYIELVDSFPELKVASGVNLKGRRYVAPTSKKHRNKKILVKVIYYLKMTKIELRKEKESGLPEPENPTGFDVFFKPEPELDPNIWYFPNPIKPKPKIQTRGYPIVMKYLRNVHIFLSN